jgi:hypothetical protein
MNCRSASDPSFQSTEPGYNATVRRCLCRSHQTRLQVDSIVCFPYPIQAWRTWSRLLCAAAIMAILASRPAAGQPLTDLSTQDRAHGTLPTENQADLLLQQLGEAISSEDADRTVSLLKALEPYGDSLTAADGGLYYRPVSEVVANMTAKATRRVAEIYRRLHDPTAAVIFEQAREMADVDTLAKLFAQHPLSTHWPDFGRELVELYLDNGRFTEAAIVSDRLRRTLSRPPEVLQYQHVAALAGTGALQAARRELTALNEQDAAHRAVADWIDSLRHETDGASSRHSVELHPSETWQASLIDEDQYAPISSSSLAELALRQRRSLQIRPVVTQDRIVVRRATRLLAFDRTTLLPIWENTIAEQASFDEPFPDRSMQLDTQSLQDALLQDGWQRAVTADGQRVYVLDLLRRQFRSGRMRGSRLSLSGAFAIVARHLNDGTIAWTLSSNDLDAPQTLFLTPPEPVGNLLAVLFQRGADIGLMLLDPETGTRMHEHIVLGPPNFPNPAGGQFFLHVQGRDLYVISGNGMVGALALETPRDQPAYLRWRWAVVYPSELVSPEVQRFTRRDVTRLRPARRPLVFEDLLVLAPIDADLIIAIDRLSGRKRWEVPRQSDESLIGVCPQGVILSGQRIRCVALTDGQTELWRAVPLPSTGQAEIIAEHVFVPTRDGICVLDCRTGRVIDDQWQPESSSGETYPPIGVVVADGEDVLLTTGERVIRYAAPLDDDSGAADIDSLSRNRRLAQTYAAACRAAATGQAQRAYELLDRAEFSESDYATPASALRGQLALYLARHRPEEQLAWLQRVSEAGGETAKDPRIQLELARAYAANDAWSAAYDQVRDVLVSGADELASDPADRGLSQSSWLAAGQMLIDLISQQSSADTEKQLAALIELLGAAERPLRLMRLLEQLPDSIPTDAAREQLTLWGTRPLTDFGRSPLRPEWLQDFLAEDRDDLPAEQRWRLALRRMDTYVSIGQVGAAERELALLNNIDAEGSFVPSRAERRSQRRVEIALREASSDQTAPPVSPAAGRRWRHEPMRLAMDGMLTDLPAAMISIRTADDPNALKTLRLTPGDWRESTQHIVRNVGLEDDPIGMISSQALQELAYAATYVDGVALVPVDGGLIGIGLAPYYLGGKRLWKLPDAALAEAVRNRRYAPAGRQLILRTQPNELVALDSRFGQVRWKRTFSEPMDEYHCTEDLVVVLDRNQVAAFYHAFDGIRLEPAERLPEFTQMMLGTRERILLWGESELFEVTADSPHTKSLNIRSFGASPAPKQALGIAGRDWIAVQDYSGAWTIRDLATGVIIPLNGDIGPEAVGAIAADHEHLYVARSGFDLVSNSPVIELLAFGLAPGVSDWRLELPGGEDIHVSALLASDTWIPVFRYERLTNENNATVVKPRIDFVRKLDGTTEPLSKGTQRLLAEDTSFGGDSEEVNLYATPNRIILQTDKALIGLGDSLECQP